MRYCALFSSLLLILSISAFSGWEEDGGKEVKQDTEKAGKKKVAKKQGNKKVTKEKKEKAAKKDKNKVKKDKPEKAAKKAQEKKKTPKKSVGSSVSDKPAAVQDVTVGQLSVCKSVENLTPKGEGNEFTADVGALCCLTRIKGAKDTMEVLHKWYKDGKITSVVPLAVKSLSWRTYSRKELPEDPVGEWKIEIVNGTNDEVVKETSFVVKPAE